MKNELLISNADDGRQAYIAVGDYRRFNSPDQITIGKSDLQTGLISSISFVYMSTDGINAWPPTDETTNEVAPLFSTAGPWIESRA